MGDRAPNLPVGLVPGPAAVGDQGVAELVGNSHAGGPGAKDQQAQVGQVQLADPGGGGDGRQRDHAGALDVVVEAAQLGAVRLQQPVGVGQAKVLKVQHRLGKQLPDSLHEGVDKIVCGSVSWPCVVVGSS